MENIPIAKAHNKLSALLKRLRKNPITLTKRGVPVGVLLSPEEYARLLQAEAYGGMVRLSHSLRETGLTASELYRASRDELENK
ncbi:MAG: type II toxin-antitoxin system Phd/YefM family antitoxin [Anaerolineales bacterium]